MSQALCFNDVTLTPITHQNSIWIKASELARALGYKRADIITKLYSSNSDEFTADMTQVIEIVDNTEMVFPVKTRIFSLRGCHLIAMFARTAVAKAFRKWVLDVLDKLAVEALAAQPALPDTSPLTQSSRAELKAIVDAKLSTYPSDIQGKARSEIWTRFNRHFKIAEYAQLPMCQMPDARDYLVEMKPKALATIEAKAEPAALPPSVPATRGRDRVKSSTEEQLSELLDEAYHLRDARIEFDKLFDKLSVITGPLYKQALASMRRTDDNVCTDSLIQTLHSRRWDAKEHVRDAANAAMEACRSAIVVARLLGV